MKDRAAREYRWYVLGCRLSGETEPLPEEAFRLLYRRYRRYRSVSRLVDRLRRQSIPILRSWNTCRSLTIEWPLFDWLFRKLSRLNWLGELVEAGRRLDSEEGGAAVPSYSKPRTPVLAGAAAKLLPPLDPEPAWRDP